ncbi:hypothetical protein L6452_00625 [Arctium lappa]|uniref:Uncharacterized protein n=1 Tax=Arctium lappa TaxID=4217 RepID=A0ACB9FEK3_ARCLA|nr:hypothetical protein L6452_00625 [Arctium lappa]
MKLAVASTHISGNHVCVVRYEDSRLEYSDTMEKIEISPKVDVGEPTVVVKGLEVIVLLVVDSRKKRVCLDLISYEIRAPWGSDEKIVFTSIYTFLRLVFFADKTNQPFDSSPKDKG